MKNALLQRVPGLEVVGSNYPPAPAKVLLARLVGGVQFSVIGAALAGDKLFGDNGQAPAWVRDLQQNKVQSCAAAWFLGNIVHQNLMSTGAFEVRGRPQTAVPFGWVRSAGLTRGAGAPRAFVPRFSTTASWCSANWRVDALRI